MNLLALNMKRYVNLQNRAMQLLSSIRNAGCYTFSAKCPKSEIRKSACADAKKFKARDLKQYKEPFKSMWESAKCDLSVANCPPARFDALYYKPSNKATRKYQQTWVSCPPRLIKPTVKCEFPQDKYPPLEKRSHNSRPKTARCPAKSGQMSCSGVNDLKQNKKCLKLTIPGCRAVRSGVRCKVVRGPDDCKPVPCPYPSFSECRKPASKPKPNTECECLKLRSMCEVWTILRKKAIL